MITERVGFLRPIVESIVLNGEREKVNGLRSRLDDLREAITARQEPMPVSWNPGALYLMRLEMGGPEGRDFQQDLLLQTGSLGPLKLDYQRVITVRGESLLGRYEEAFWQKSGRESRLVIPLPEGGELDRKQIAGPFYVKFDNDKTVFPGAWYQGEIPIIDRGRMTSTTRAGRLAVVMLQPRVKYGLEGFDEADEAMSLAEEMLRA